MHGSMAIKNSRGQHRTSSGMGASKGRARRPPHTFRGPYRIRT
jgi:hypothetical protein